MKIKKKSIVTAAILSALLALSCAGATCVYAAPAPTLKVTTHQWGTCKECGDKRGDGRNDWKYPGQATNYRWVSYTDPVTGKKKRQDAYCLNPAKTSPDPGKEKAGLIAGSRADRMANVLYFGKGGPGEQALKDYLGSHKSTYPDCQSGTGRYVLIHYALTYASHGEKDSSISVADSSFQKQVKKAYAWMKNNAKQVSDPTFGFSPASVTAAYDGASGKYKTPQITMAGADRDQYVKISVPAGAVMEVTHNAGTKSYSAGSTAQVYVGDRFSFTMNASGAAAFTRTLAGELTSVTPYEILAGSKSDQDVSFFGHQDEASASFTVKVQKPPMGKVKIYKSQRKMDGSVKQEGGITFRLWDQSKGTYEQAVQAGAGSPVPYAAEITTGTDGIAYTPDLSPGTYYVRQMNGSPGYAYMDPNPRTVTITADQTTPVPGDEGGVWIYNEELGIELEIMKVDEDSEQLITSSAATFGIYSDAGCSEAKKIKEVSTSAGIAHCGRLSEGTYFIKELAAPDGYHLSTKIDKVVLKYDTAEKVDDVTYKATYTKADARIEYHDVDIVKHLQEGDEEKTFRFQVELDGISADDNVTVTYSPDGQQAQENIGFTIEGDSVVINPIVIKKGGSIRIRHLPVGAKYTITEQAAPDYKGSYKVTPAKAAKSPSDSGQTGEALSVKEKVRSAADVNDPSYTNVYEASAPITYDWTNRNVLRHALVIKKTSAGIERDENDEFEYTVEFSDLGGVYPGYSVYAINNSGEKIVYGSAESQEVTGAASKTYPIRLKSGWEVKFTDVKPNAKYRITEGSSDYQQAYTVDEVYGNIPKTQDASEANRDLVTGVNTMPDASVSRVVVFSFENIAVSAPTQNDLIVRKSLATRDASEEFSFTASLKGLEKNSLYALVKPGDKTYTLTASIDGAIVEDNTGSGIGGIPLVLTRNDGKRKIVRTAAGGTADFSAFGNWIRQKGGSTVTIGWLGDDLTIGAQAGTKAVSGYEISSIESNASGNAEAAFTLHHDETARIPGLADNSTYAVTENGNKYEPSYTVRRVRGGRIKTLDSGSNGPMDDFETDWQRMPIGGGAVDTVTFVNSTQSRNLKVTKTAEGGLPGTLFSYHAKFRGLTRDSYYAVIPGSAQARITSDVNGNLAVTVTGSAYFDSHGGDLSGLPVTIIRSDGQRRTMYTDSEGKVAAGTYTDWLRTVPEDRNYTIEFLKARFSAQW